MPQLRSMHIQALSPPKACTGADQLAPPSVERNTWQVKVLPATERLL